MSSTPRAVAGASIDAGAADHLAPVYAQFPIDVVGASGVHLVRATADACSISTGVMRSPRWATGTRAGSRRSPSRRMRFPSRATPCRSPCGRAPPRGWCVSRRSPLDTVFFCNTGAEANENALKLALRITGRRKVVAVEGSFHGRTAAAGAVTWGAASKWYGFPQAPFDVEFLPRRDASAIARTVGADVAAVIVEPVQGVAGAVDLGGEWLQALRTRCDAAGALLVFDEVQCGMGRTGYPFAANLYGTTPDMITTAKALGAGFPCAALLMSPDVARELATDDLGTTFGGGPLACAMMEAVIDIIEQEGPARERAAARRAAARDLHRGSGRRRSRARDSSPGSARAARRRTCSSSCSRATFSPAPARIRTSCGYSRPTCSRNGTSSSCAMRLRGWRHEALHGPRGLRAR